MPLSEGVPSSAHGMVLPDGTAAFRPVELAILRGAQRWFVYGGQGTTWDRPMGTARRCGNWSVVPASACASGWVSAVRSASTAS